MFAPPIKPGKRIAFLFFACVLFFFLLMLCVPLVSDDLEFSKLRFSGFADLMDYILHYGNGRVLGNLCAITLVKYPVTIALVKALIISCIIFLIPALLGVESPSGYALSFFLFASIPQTLFAQVYSWASGFFNYLPPVWITLIILFLL